MVFGVSTIFLYENRNSVDGFQYALGDPVFNCAEPSTAYDCVIKDSAIDIKDNITFTNLAWTASSCASKGLTGYSDNCTIYEINSVGSYLGNVVLELTLTLASQKVLVGPEINNNEIGPDFGKVDIRIKYPWVDKMQAGNKDKGHVALALYAAGRAGGGSVKAASYRDKSALVWSADTYRSAVFTWSGNADIKSTIGDTTSESYAVFISDQAVLDFQLCYNILDINCVISYFIISAWKWHMNAMKILGWSTQVVILSWKGVGADDVFYDPGLGMETAAGMFLTPTFICFAMLLVHYFFRK